jgi:hypothetical protein
MTDNFGNPQDGAQQNQPTSEGSGAPYQQQPPQQPNQQSYDPRYTNQQSPYTPRPQDSYNQAPYNQGPYGQQPFGQQNFYAPSQGYAMPPVAPWNVMAIVGFVLCFVFAPAGLVISIVALVQIRKSHERGNGLALAGTIVGGVFTAIIAIVVGLVIWGIGLAATTGYEYYSDPSCSSYSDYSCYDDSDTIDSALRTYVETNQTPLKQLSSTELSAMGI